MDSRDQAIAIVGVGASLPGASGIDVFWSNVREGKCVAREVPPGRWPAEPASLYSPEIGRADHVYSTRGCFLDSPSSPDLTGLDVDPDLLSRLDPVFALAVDVCTRAWREAGPALAAPQRLKSRTGVILANIVLPTDAASRYTRQTLGAAFERRTFGRRVSAAAPEVHPFDRFAAGMPAAMVADALGLGGAAWTLDAACASSLYAIKLACDELAEGRADAMITGGISRPDCLFTQMGFSQLRALSPRGVPSPFDASADGLVVGEGGVAFVLRRLKDAVAEGRPVLGVIRGIGLSNDRGGSLLAPDSEGQLRSLRAAYERAGWDTDSPDLIECHATGTPLGDATEVASLRMLRGASGGRRPCVLGSVKSNVGHLLTAAGAVGVLKVLQAIKHRTLPPTANFSAPATALDLDSTPFRILREAESWTGPEGGGPRRAAVSAFGFGGINAHVLIEEFDVEAAERRIVTPASNSAVTGTPSAAEVSDIAISGLEITAGEFRGAADIADLARNDRDAFSELPADRWWGLSEKDLPGVGALARRGAWIPEVAVPAGRFRIPPNELREMLPQQILMLGVVDQAVTDAGGLDESCLDRTGVFIGISLDLNTTNTGLRWTIPAMVDALENEEGAGFSAASREKFSTDLRDAVGPPLTPNRTLGGLGGMVASRIAREFRIGGPSFTVSSEECSGLHALKIACDALRRGELDQAIVGAVELDGDVRALLLSAGVRAAARGTGESAGESPTHRCAAAEGAVAMVLRRVADAEARGDAVHARIREVVSGRVVGSVDSRMGMLDICPTGDQVRAAALLEIAVSQAGEIRAARVQEQSNFPVAVTESCAALGFSTAASGLMSTARTALALSERILPPSSALAAPGRVADAAGADFHIPFRAQYWVADECERPRTAAVLCAGSAGGLARVTMCEANEPARRDRPESRPMEGEELLFPLSAGDRAGLLERIEELAARAGAAADEGAELWRLCRSWIREAFSPGGEVAVVVATNGRELRERLGILARALRENPDRRLEGISGIFYSPEPLARQGGEVAFVYPGSGNSRIGMGRDIQVRFPFIMDRLGDLNRLHHTQMMPEIYMPRRADRPADWRAESEARLAGDHAALIVGHVSHAIVMSDLIRSFGVEPVHAVGYSLGESTALFALRAWTDRDEMMRRMNASPLFRTEMVAPYDAARKTWNVPTDEAVRWGVGIVDLPAAAVREKAARFERVYLLIVNAPRECVIGGDPREMERFVAEAGCAFVPLEGISAVHSEVAAPVRDEYRAFHHFETSAPEGIAFYSGARGAEYEVTADSAADAVTAQAVEGIDFPATVMRAWERGARVFVEVGPGNSCSRMIDRILEGRPHVARSACVRDRDGVSTLVRLLAQLIADGVPADLSGLYPAPIPGAEESVARPMIRVRTGGEFGSVTLPMPTKRASERAAAPESSPRSFPSSSPISAPVAPGVLEPVALAESAALPEAGSEWLAAAARSATGGRTATARAHSSWLRFSSTALEVSGRTLGMQMELARRIGGGGSGDDGSPDIHDADNVAENVISPAPFSADLFMSREQCLEFGRGKVGPVLGEAFAGADDFPTRVRLPDEPLMLVDRIIRVEGEPRSMGSGRLITEHDVLREGWYLDHDTMPTGLSVEAGQADLFLSGYLGIDFETRGLAMYRLLDAQVVFHRRLPRPGEVIRYDIRIERFIRQGETHIFFFNFDAFIGDAPLMSMRNGSAGFFTRRQLDEGKGLVLTEAESRPVPGVLPPDWRWPLAPRAQILDAAALDALRRGDSGACFGSEYRGARLVNPIRIPSGRMGLVDRAEIIPGGGRFGLGLVRSETDIRPDDWFLTCHFIDDNVMPGTLMYESCMQTLRLFLMRIGWNGDASECMFEPVPGTGSRLRCRGQVIASTRRAAYEIHIKELGYNPEPYALADAVMFADDRPVVLISDMSVRLRGATRESVESLWSEAGSGGGDPLDAVVSGKPQEAVYDRRSILEFCHGSPSKAFGPVYAPFDHDRFLARLPSPPYLCMDRVTAVGGTVAEFKAGAWVETQFDIDPAAWYFRANRQEQMPFSILIEHALQACGWLSAYVGSALTTERKLQYRNLDGRARLLRRVDRYTGTLTTRAILTDISRAGDMIIQKFRLRVWSREGLVYDGDTAFGFFTPASLASQAGVTGARRYQPDGSELSRARSFDIPGAHPETPDDPESTAAGPLALPATAYRMIERIESWVPDGGPAGLGFIRGGRPVRESDWYFKAHFHQDPVQPGSLGLEAFLQLLKIAAIERWGEEIGATHEFPPIFRDEEHVWKYRGQVLPGNREITAEAVITSADDENHILRGEGFLIVDGLIIYEMKNFGIRAEPVGGGRR